MFSHPVGFSKSCLFLETPTCVPRDVSTGQGMALVGGKLRGESLNPCEEQVGPSGHLLGLWCLSFLHLRGLRWEEGMGKMLQPHCWSVQLWFQAGKRGCSGLEG